MAWCYSRMVIAYTKYLDIIIYPVPLNPLQNHSAEHFACHIKQHNITPVLQRLKSLNERARRYNITLWL